MNVLVIQNDPIVPVGQLSAFLGGHEVVRAWEDPRTDNSTTIVTTENIAISTVRRRRTYVSSRVDIIRYRHHSDR